jgi:hypothetical protein
MSQKIIATLPLGRILVLTGKLLRYARGGITKDEAVDLMDDLIEIIAHIAEQANAPVQR